MKAWATYFHWIDLAQYHIYSRYSNAGSMNEMLYSLKYVSPVEMKK